MDAELRDAESLARELLPRLRRWTSDNWAVAAELPADGSAELSRTGYTGSSGAGSSRAGSSRAGSSRAGSRRTGSTRAGPGRSGPSRADVAAASVQRLADVGAEAEGQPRRPVPRLADVNLADQLTVVVEDILRTGDPAAVRAAAAELAALRTALGYR